ncbi:MAG: VWA domain-containing protein [Thermodesulfobacteriota bacterium]|nr:VWA domain-containing protein [Thermodesulfobacteriota bacterium]
MIEPVLKFAACCRAAEFFVSTAEVLDTLNQLQHVDLLDEPVFKTVVQANFVKTHRDRPRFESLYHLFFHGHQFFPTDDTDKTGKQAALDLVAQMAASNEQAMPNDRPINSIDAALLDFLSGNPQAYLAMLQQMDAPEEGNRGPLKSNLGELANRLEVMLKINQIRSRSLALANEQLADRPATREQVESYFNGLLDRASTLLTDDVGPANAGLLEVKQVDEQFPNLGNTPFSNLTQVEIDAMREIIDRLVRRLKEAATRRFAARTRGVLDIKKTLRNANRFQGVPLTIAYRKRPPKKGKIVTLCDVSGSVWSAARFMLNMIYALQDCFAGVKSYIFIAGVADISGLFARHPINTAIDKAMSEGDIDYNAFTDYGETFLQFKERHLSVLNKRTTLIIIGDGRSNYMNPRTEVLGEMREKCKRIIWLNPESINTWHSGDSEMRSYRHYCHELRPCQNLNQLTAFVTDLVL